MKQLSYTPFVLSQNSHQALHTVFIVIHTVINCGFEFLKHYQHHYIYTWTHANTNTHTCTRTHARARAQTHTQLYDTNDVNRHPHNGPHHINRPQRHPVSSGNDFRSPPSNYCPPLVSLFQSRLWRVGKMPSRKADQLTFNIWYSVSVHYGNKLNSVLALTMSVIAQTVTYIIKIIINCN